jgi:catechol 2,3-dioxygenase-like lactoylglutathione lyase family enzyme
MASVPRLQFSHFGMYVTDIARMEDFYTRVLGFAVTDRGPLETMSETPHDKKPYLVFLSRDPRDHHQIVMVSGRPKDSGFNPINQISFRVDGLADLREMHRRVQGEPAVTEIFPVSHGNALSVYFRDPEGNRLEVFIDTPWYCHQPIRMPLDLKLSDEELWRAVEAEVRKAPDYKPVEDWRAEVTRRIAG